MRTLQGEYIGVDPLVGRICAADVVDDDGRYVRTVYGPYHRIVGGASVGDPRTDILTTACGLDLPHFESVLHPPDSSFLTMAGRSWLSESPRCGECFSA